MQLASDTQTHTHAAVNTHKYVSYDGKGENTTNQMLTILLTAFHTFYECLFLLLILTYMENNVEDGLENDDVRMEGSFGGLLLLLDMFVLIVHILVVLLGHSDKHTGGK